MESTTYLPMPGQAKMVSVRMAPPSSSPRDRPAMVTVGMREFLKACLSTTRAADSPLALAVVM